MKRLSLLMIAVMSLTAICPSDAGISTVNVTTAVEQTSESTLADKSPRKPKKSKKKNPYAKKKGKRKH